MQHGGLVDERQDAMLELGEGCLGDGFLVVLGFKIAAREQCNQILQATAAEFRGKRERTTRST